MYLHEKYLLGGTQVEIIQKLHHRDFPRIELGVWRAKQGVVLESQRWIECLEGFHSIVTQLLHITLRCLMSISNWTCPKQKF